MRKIVLCSLLFGLIFVNGKGAFAEGQICHQTPDGKVVCNYIDRGGDMEHGICYRKKGGDNDKAAADEESWTEDWWAKKEKTDCTAQKKGASWAQCIDNPGKWQGRTGIGRSCAAFDCQSDYLLYTTNTRLEIPVVGENRRVGSQGLCREKSFLKSLCDVGCGCKDDEKCVLNEVAVTHHGRTVQAFIGEELCVCEKDPNYVEPGPCDGLEGAEKKCCQLEKVAKQPVQWNKEEGICECTDKTKELKNGKCVDKGGITPDLEGECVYTFKGYVDCGNGKEVYKSTSVKLTKEEAAAWQLKCGTGEEITISEKFKQDKENFKKLVEKICGKPQGNTGPGYNDAGDDYEYLGAKERLDTFMRNTDLNRNVWKNAEGKFNTARLASDLTAGVVLGTVGGIVSANIIKKKQVEKGFDALNCTIGGQKVADWGDEFTVGLHRY